MPVERVMRVWNAIEEAPKTVQARAVVLVGPEGCGRTHVLDRIADRVGGGARILRARWTAAGDYLIPFLDLVDARLVRGRMVTKTQHKLMRHAANVMTVVPVINDYYKLLFNLRVQDELAQRTPIDAAVSDEAFWHAYRRRWRSVRREGPVVALLDDVQRLDTVGARAWRFLGRLVEDIGAERALLVLACATPDAAAERRVRAAFDASVGAGRWELVPVPPLDDEAARASVLELLGGHPVAGARWCVDEIVQLSRGNRRLLQCATEAVRDSGDDEGSWRAALARIASHDLGDLRATERRLCELLAGVEGRLEHDAIPTEAFHRYWNIGMRDADEALASAVGRTALPVARAAILERMPPARRRADLRAYALALQEAFERRREPALLDAAASWFEAADDGEASAHAVLQAARSYAAAERSAEAHDRLAKALSMLGDQLAPEARLQLVLEQADAAFRAGDATRAGDALAAADALAGQLPPAAAAAARGAVSLARGTLKAHGPNADRRAAVEDFDAAVASGNRAVEARARAEKAFCLAPFDPVGAEAEGRGALATARAAGARADELFAQHLLGEVLSRRGSADSEAERHLRDVADATDTSPRLRAHALDSLANHYSRAGRLDEAVESFGASITLKSELGDRDGLARSYGGLGRLHHRRGEFAKAAELYELDLDLIAEATPADAMAFVQINNLRAEVDRLSGKFDDARRRLDVSFERLRELPVGTRAVPEGYTHLIRAKLLLDEGRADESEAELYAAAPALVAMSALASELDVARARIAQARGSLENARDLLDRARGAATEPYAVFEVERRAAVVARSMGKRADAERSLGAAHAAAAALGNAWMLRALEADGLL